MKKPFLSVIIIAKDEEGLIGKCLESTKGVDEVVLIDSGSTDQTIAIAQGFGARVVRVPSQKLEFAKWRNRGLKEAKGDWVFYLDADERLTPELKKEIREKIKKFPPVAYELPRRNFYLGQEMHYGGAWPDYVKRLFLKEKLASWQGELHEAPTVEGEWGRLKQPLLHYTHRDLSSMIAKTSQWSKIEARLLFAAGHPPVNCHRLLRPMLTEFWQRGIKKQGIRDGTVGWIEIIFQMFSRFITYARLWELQWQRKK